MTRLFEDAGKPKVRKWQCFVCGRNYNDFSDYKEHILAEHEEGREYLDCPTCNTPVRDLKTHYKVKHPQRVMPKGMQTQVSVWHDFKTSSDKKNKKTTRKPKFRSGFFVSQKSGCQLEYRSGMECEFFECLEADKDVLSFYSEPFKVPYHWNGKWHKYIPDIRVNYIDGSTEIWEIKPANQTTYKQNQAKWTAMNEHAKNVGWQFIVQTEIGLNKLKQKIKNQQS